jgi:hypothetical protein
VSELWVATEVVHLAVVGGKRLGRFLAEATAEEKRQECNGHQEAKDGNRFIHLCYNLLLGKNYCVWLRKKKSVRVWENGEAGAGPL